MNLSERDAELRLLQQIYSRSVDGKGAVALVNAPVGCGKTALIQSFAGWVGTQEGRFLSVTASASERFDWLGLVDRLMSAMRAEGMVEYPFAAEDGAGAVAGLAAIEAGRVPLALLQRICRAVIGFAGEGPLVIAVDDVHFADDASLDCLSYLIRRIDTAPIMVVLTESSCHEQGLVTFHAETLHLPSSHRVRLGTLGLDGVAGQLAARGVIPPGAREAAEPWTRTSGGNPLLLHALIDDVAEDGRPQEPGAPGRRAGTGQDTPARNGSPGRGASRQEPSDGQVPPDRGTFTGKGATDRDAPTGQVPSNRSAGGSHTPSRQDVLGASLAAAPEQTGDRLLLDPEAVGERPSDGAAPTVGRGPAGPAPVGVRTRVPVPGESFRYAVLRCLHRGEAALLSAARALAVLGEQASPALVADLLGEDITSVRRSIAELHAAGLVSGVRFRHERARTAVLADIPTKDLFAMRSAAAHLLHESGASAIAVAEQLLATHDPGAAAWQPGILRRAARDARDAGDIGTAVEYLRHASGICTDPGQEAAVTAALAETQWLIDPPRASRYLPQLDRMVRDGRLPVSQALVAVEQLAWRGDFAQADTLLRIIEGRAAAEPADHWDGVGPASSAVRAGLRLVRLQLSFWQPGSEGDPRADPPPGPDLMSTVPARLPAGAMVDLTAGVVTSEHGPPGTRGIAPVARLASPPTGLFLRTTEGRRTDDPESWPRRLLEEPGNRRVPMRRALLEAHAAAEALRVGDIPSAAEAARASLTLVGSEAWGVVIGVPLSLAVRAATTGGDFDTAMAYLDVPVPAAMFETPFALPYLHSLGRHHLGAGRPGAALRHFETCGELMARWGLDLPELVDWRAGVAAALEATGDSVRGRETYRRRPAPRGEEPRLGVSDEPWQLSGDGPRSAFATLRALVATSAPDERLPLLQEALRLLEAGGDTEFRRPSADTEAVRSAYRDTAERERAWPWEAPTGRPEPEELPQHHRSADAEPFREPTGELFSTNGVPDSLLELTSAELRVGALAASGCTNREIAGKLFITVSTVEQHLTKIYRKLKVRRRKDLPTELRSFTDLPCAPNGG
ncbi:AAA family ATPase [Streptomyces sp. NPDC088794]|uniref:helix-turn-helix transcriptional regulator n=1 Tax=Streptomyces sp. NPDC088794 TaxID=3365902 RepID=UPI003814BC86